MKRNFLNWTRLCASVMFLAVLCISGCKNTSDDVDEARTLKIENGVLVSCNPEAEYVEIPNSVTKIGNNAFHNCSGLKSVSIPNSVTSIGEQAFANCTILTSISIPSGVMSIGNGAFNGCDSLTIYYAGTKAQWDTLGVTLPTGISVFCTEENPDDGRDPGLDPGQGTCTLYFYPNAPAGTPESESLEPKVITVNTGSYYTLPQEPAFSVEGYYFVGWTESPDYAYFTYKPGDEIYIPTELNVPDTFILYAVWADTTCINGLRIYGNTVVGYVKEDLPADVVIPDGITAIGWRAFYTSNYPCQMKSVTIPGSVQIIEDEAFSNCPNLEKVVIKDGGGLNEIGYYTFFWCESLKSVELPDNVKKIGKEAFCHCPKLESITMNGVENIEENAFFEVGLTSVYLPNTLKFIGDSAFAVCNLESVTIPDSVSVKNIGDCVFSYCKKLKKLVLPDDWNEIKEEMFMHCESLEDVNLPPALKTIGDSAFSECYSLKEVVIPEGVTEIKEGAFYYCKKLSKVTIPNSVKTIRRMAFLCSPLSEIIIPDNTTVESCAFSISTNLRTVSIPASMINAGMEFPDIFTDGDYWDHADCPELEFPILDDCLYDCRNIEIILRDGPIRIPKDFLYSDAVKPNKYKSIKIPDGVKTIEEGAFCNAYFDIDIVFPDSVTVLKDYALSSCGFAGKLPDKLEYIGEYALAGYFGESMTILGSVKSFGEFAFYDSNLKFVTIEPGVTEIPGAAFAALNGKKPGYLEKVEIPNTVTKIGDSAFFYQPNLTDVTIPDSVKVIEHEAFVGCENLNAQVTGKWYREKDGERVDAVDPSGKNLYYYSGWNWYRED